MVYLHDHCLYAPVVRYTCGHIAWYSRQFYVHFVGNNWICSLVLLEGDDAIRLMHCFLRISASELLTQFNCHSVCMYVVDSTFECRLIMCCNSVGSSKYHVCSWATWLLALSLQTSLAS